ncbi:serine hydrolase [Actinoplanes sp. G11-F43]|uniref:serine hydrolase domain-containing protein n=1 Tax=Actinoplanes sp. G11-F43 TaxID=3424130 RepID=UPI003D3509C1
MIKLRFVVYGVVAGLVAGAPAPAAAMVRPEVLRPGSPRQAGLLAGPVEALPAIAASYLRPTEDHPDHPTYAGATVLAARNGVVVSRFAVGDAVRYASPASELPPERRVPARVDTLWDVASISKLFTTIVVLQQVEKGRVELEAPVTRYVPEFPTAGVTVRHLLTHTSGLPAFLPFYSLHSTPELRLAAALRTPVTAGTTPGNQYVYSDIGLIVLGVIAERATGRPLDEAVRAGVTGPLRMHDTGYNPPITDRVAATEYQPYVGRGMVRGQVHDENAWSLGGVAGHAGVFSTVDDLAILCQTLLNGGVYRGMRILSERMIRRALVNYNADLLAQYPEASRGLGFELAKHWYMDGMTSPFTFGHTGFTGTSVVIDPLDRSFLVLLSNRVHPDRAWGTNNAARRALARAFAAAHPIAGPAREKQQETGTATAVEAETAPAVGEVAAVPAVGEVAAVPAVGEVAAVPVVGEVAAVPAVGEAATAPAAGEKERAEARTWRTDLQDGAVMTLTARLGRGDLLLWYDTEPTVDHLTIESTTDGRTWAPVSLILRSGRETITAETLSGFGGRHWWTADPGVPPGTVLRFSYRTDAASQGRGVLVAGLGAVESADGWTRQPDRADGWTRQPDRTDGWARRPGSD